MKRINIYKILFVIVFTLSGIKTNAQKMAQNVAAWVGYEMYLPFKEDGRWGLLLE